MESESFICVAPISPTYSPTHRYLFYTALLLSILYPTPPPLVKGAFAFSLTYSATAALYAMLLLSSTPKPSSVPSPSPVTTNLDIPALTAILSASAIAVLPLQVWTKSLSRSARNILRIWGIFVTIGLCATFALLVRAKTLVTLSTSPTDVVTLESCPPSSGKLKLRNPHEVDLVEFDRVFGKSYSIIVKHTSALVFLPLLFGLLACIVTIRPPQSEYYKDDGTWNPDGHSYALDSGLGANASASSTIATRFSLRKIFLKVRKAVLHLTPWCWLTVVVVSEIYLLGKGKGEGALPEVESMGEVGQWGVLAGLGFVAAAAAWNEIIGQEELKKMGADEIVV